MTGPTFSGNSAGLDGGALFNMGAMTVSGTLTDNTAEFDGGAVYNQGLMTILSSTLNGNSDRDSGDSNGGALYNTAPGTMTVGSSTLADNHAAAGGAISSGGALTLTATTISQNSAEIGGGIASQVAPRLVDTIVAANTLASGSGSDPDIYGSVLAASSDDLIGNGTGLSGISGGVNQNQVGTAAVPINPMLDPLGNYGGPTETMPFRTGSPAAAKGGIVTTLTGNISATATVIPVADAAVFASTNTQVAIRINSETFWVEGVNLTDNTLTVMRAPGDGAAVHSIGAGIYLADDQIGNTVPSTPAIGAVQTVVGYPISVALSGPTSSGEVAGTPFNLTIKAEDSLGNVVTSDDSTVTLTSSDGQFIFVSPITLHDGTTTVSVNLDKADSLTLTAKSGSLTGTIGFTVHGAVPYSLAVSAPSTAKAGVAFDATISAKDWIGNLANGPVTLTSSDHEIDETVDVINGSAVVPVTLDLARGVTLTVTAGGHTATSGTITVAPGPAVTFAVVAPSSVTVGDTFNATVTPKDRFGNTTTIGVPYSSVTATNGMTVNGEGGTFADPAEALTNSTVGLQAAAKSVTITFNAGSVHGTSNSITVNPDWFSENISDPWVQETARAAYKANGGLTYNAWLQVFTTVGDQYSSLPSSAMSSLQVLLNNAAFLNSPASDTDLASKVIAGDPDNATYNSLNSQDVVATTNLGNLAVNSPSSQLKELVNKWFLGVNYPSSTYGTGPGGSAPNATPSYQLVTNVPLFASGESSSHVNYYAVQQGQIGDCWVLASLAAVAEREPQAIWSMITPNGNETYTVRFIEPNGTPDFVTVNDELPSGGNIFASVTHANPGSSNSTELWVALIEKAYAQENSEGWLPSNDPGSDSYQAINYILSNDAPAYGTVGVLSAITGSPTSSPGVNPGTLGADWLNGDPVVLGTPDSPQVSINGVNIVEGHVYAVIGYNPATSSAPAEFTLFSPWGLNGSSYTPAGFTTSVYCAGIVTANPSQVSATFIYGTDSGASALPANAVDFHHDAVDSLFDAADDDPDGLEDGSRSMPHRVSSKSMMMLTGSHRTRASIVRLTGQSGRTPVVYPVDGLFFRSSSFRGVPRLLPSTTWGGNMN